MKPACTFLLTAACALLPVTAFADDSAPTAAESKAETKADRNAKADDLATDGKTQADSAKTKTDNKAKSDGNGKTNSDTSKEASKGKTPTKGNLATRAASFVAGTIVGMPVAIVREIGGETKIATKDLVGETNNWFLIVPALPMGFIGGCLSAAPQGLMFGVKNAWEGSHDEPFGREAFSLADELEK